jgi:hypothetical protein
VTLLSLWIVARNPFIWLFLGAGCVLTYFCLFAANSPFPPISKSSMPAPAGKKQSPGELTLPGAGVATVYRIYSRLEEDGKTLRIFGGNKTGYDLQNASHYKIRHIFGHYAGFDPSVTFETIFKNGSNRVGSWAGTTSIIPALSDGTGMCGYVYSGVPPQLPGDGQTVDLKVKPASRPPGNDVLWLTFSTRPESTHFLLVKASGRDLETRKTKGH